MDLRRLTYFVTVVETGSISGAAERLHMSQPPLSQAIKMLEHEMGATLLQRHARGVSPTPAGLHLLEQGRDLLRWSERITEQVSRLGSGESGRLAIASVPTFAWSNLPSLLQDFNAAAPDIEVQLSDPTPEGVLRMVANGTADIGFVATSDPAALAAAHPELQVDGLIDLPLSLGVAASIAARSDGSRARAEDYADTSWYIPEDAPGFPGLDETLTKLWRDAGFHPRSVQYVATLQTALPLIAAGMGVTLLPSALTGPASAGIVALDLDIPIAPLTAASLRSRHIAAPATLLRFVEVMTDHFAGRRHAGAE